MTPEQLKELSQLADDMNGEYRLGSPEQRLAHLVMALLAHDAHLTAEVELLRATVHYHATFVQERP